MDFLDKIPLDQTAVTVAMVAIVLLFALISILKGILKTILTLISLSAAAAAFVLGMMKSPPIVEKVIPEAVGWMPLVIGGVCALLALVLIQLVLGIFSGKTKLELPSVSHDDSENEPKRKRRNPLAPLFGLFVGALALYGAITALRYFGTTAELDYLQTYIAKGSKEAGQMPLIVTAKQWLDDSPVATWHERIDFLNTVDYRARLNLAKLIIISGDRAELARALSEEANREVLKVPEINSLALTGNDLRDLCKECDFQGLYQDPRFQRLTTQTETRSELLKVDLKSFFKKDEAPAAPQGTP